VRLHSYYLTVVLAFPITFDFNRGVKIELTRFSSRLFFFKFSARDTKAT
jgi:hypothetical protein